MSNLLSKYSVIITSDVSNRDGIGIEISLNDDCILEIFRDDTEKTRKVTLNKKDLPLELIEESIGKFKKEIPWQFQD